MLSTLFLGCDFERYFGFFGCNVLKISIKSNSSIVSFKISVALIFCLEDLSIDVSRVLKSPTIIVLSVFPFMYISIFFLFKFIYFYFWLRWVFVAARGLSLVAANGGVLVFAVHGLLIAVASLVAEHGL